MVGLCCERRKKMNNTAQPKDWLLYNSQKPETIQSNQNRFIRTWNNYWTKWCIHRYQIEKQAEMRIGNWVTELFWTCLMATVI